MKFDKIAWHLRSNKNINRGIYSNLRFSINKVRFHSRQETLEHFITKAILSYILFSKGQGMVTELEFKNCRVVDVVQVTEKGNLIGYEIENVKNKKPEAPIDIVEINLNKIPQSQLNVIKKLAKEIKKYVV